MSEDAVEFDFGGLAKILKALKQMPVTRVGILGGGTRKQGEVTNAEIGAKHEFGSDGMPIRSFLRQPLTDNLQNYLDESGVLSEDALKEVVRTASFTNIMKQIGIVAEKVIADAFHTGGFGKWKSHRPGYKNNTGMILVDTQQLRDSITSEVKG